MMHKKYWIPFLLILGILTGIFWGIDRYVRKKTIYFVQSICHSCKVEIDDLSLSFLRTRATVSKIHLSMGDRRDTSYDFKISSLVLLFSPRHLLKKVIFLDEVRVYSPVVEIVEGDLTIPQPQSGESSADWQFVVQKTRIEDGIFTYIRERPGTQASIHLEKIDVVVGEMGNTPEFIKQETKAKIHALLEKTGKVDISIQSPVFKRPAQADVELIIHQLDLSDMNSYFGKNDQIFLKGHLIDGRGIVHIQGKQYSSLVEAKYDGFDVDFQKGQKRGGLEAFFSDVVASAKLKKENVDEPKKQRRERAFVTRTSDESFLNAFFRALKEAALEIAQSKPTK